MKKSFILLLIAGLAAQGLRAQPAAEVAAAQSAPAAAETSDAERVGSFFQPATFITSCA